MPPYTELRLQPEPRGDVVGGGDLSDLSRGDARCHHVESLQCKSVVIVIQLILIQVNYKYSFIITIFNSISYNYNSLNISFPMGIHLL